MKQANNEIKLTSGSRIAVIGGGPAGSLFAIFAAKLAKEQNLDIHITIFDGKDFLRNGPPGCNLCAGVISETLLKALLQEDIILPDDKIQSFIKGYYHIHIAGCTYINPPRDDCTIYTVYRGNGPRFSGFNQNISFDDFMLQKAIERGAHYTAASVVGLSISEATRRPCVSFKRKDKVETADFDLLVGAFGLNTRLLQTVKKLDFGYKPPKMIKTVHAEMPFPGSSLARKHFDRIGVVSATNIRNLMFGVLTPKGNFMTISLVGKKDLSFDALKQFLEHPHVRCILKDAASPTCCHCFPQMLVGAARKPFSDRIVIIGDASFSRHFKNGLYSAFLTAKLAAESAFKFGISEHNFYQNYYKTARKLIIRDNYIGRVLFLVSTFFAKSKLLMSFYAKLLSQKPNLAVAKIIHLFSWNMLTGEIPYRKILTSFINGKTKSDPKAFKHPNYQRTSIMVKNTNSSRITNGDLVAIIGGGPGGVGCAVALKQMAQKSGMDIRVRLYEAKAESGVPRYNQCVGVLSPPIQDILQQLDIPFPHHLVQRKIDGYVLHSRRQNILLKDEEHPSLSVRRITFDKYLLNEARKRGVEVVESRVTGLEIHNDFATLYTESDNIRPAVVVGAFGLDDGSALMFRRETNYQQPRFLNSIVTKWHPEAEFIRQFENHIHAFLPTMKEIEFGAVTPKENHFTINIAGMHVDAELMDRFLSYPALEKLFPAYFAKQRRELSYFKGKFPISIAKGMYGHRYITVGDAAGLVRPFKGKGINSALLSGMYAARVMLERGVTPQAFEEYTRLNELVIGDRYYGKLVRHSANLLSNTGLLDHVIRVAQKQPPIEEALFNSISAYKPYKVIVRDVIKLRTLVPAAGSFLQVMLNGKREK